MVKKKSSWKHTFYLQRGRRIRVRETVARRGEGLQKTISGTWYVFFFWNLGVAGMRAGAILVLSGEGERAMQESREEKKVGNQ